jgi:hypothetical protein
MNQQQGWNRSFKVLRGRKSIRGLKRGIRVFSRAIKVALSNAHGVFYVSSKTAFNYLSCKYNYLDGKYK